ncbi:MAG: hypothetical protein WC969_08860 [Elusimicrobiota bacterium]|jgi:hypothetical protein
MKGAWAAAAVLVLALCVLLPVRDPDLWWHFSAAQRMLADGALPVSDWLSFTRSGSRWTDFEWLGQLLLYAPYRAGGLAAVWVFKAVFLAMTAAVLASGLRGEEGASAPAGAAALGLWGACLVPRSDARVELFSLLFFALLLARADAYRRGAARRLAPAWACAAFFALWANLHAGFAAGLAVLALCALGELFRLEGSAHLRMRSWLKALACGAAGTLLTPFGVRLYSALAVHAADGGTLARLIVEWRPLDPSRPAHWPAFLLILLLAAVLLKRPAAFRRAPAAWLLAALFAALSLRHARFAPYLACAAVPLVASGLAGLYARAARAASALILAFCVLSTLRSGAELELGRAVFTDVLIPAQGAAFIARTPELHGRRFYHPWGWGGYLGYALQGRLKVFQDGRYIFHPLFAESARAARSPEAWAAFLDERGVEAALVENLPFMRPGTRVHADGSTAALRRPWYASYFPSERWALLHSDERALLLVRRAAFDARWVAAREYRLYRPHDEEAFADALAHGEVSGERYAAERERNLRESAVLAAVPVGRL